MKFVILIMLITLASCTSTIEQAPAPLPIPIVFMSHEQIKAAFALKEVKGVELSPEAQARLTNSIPLATFFTKKQLSELKTQRALKKVEVIKELHNGSADLREYDSPIETQFGGTCTAHGLRNVIDNISRTRVSTRHIWSKYRQYSCDDAINANLDTCITRDASWPHDSIHPLTGYLSANNCNTYLKTVTAISDNISRMKSSLDEGSAVYLGITVTNSMVACDTALKPYSKATSGGHALAIVGYKDDPSISGGGYFTVKNSWGSDCADHGYQYIPYSYCTRNDMYCVMWTIDDVQKVGPSTPPTPAPKTCLKWSGFWFWKNCVEWSS